MTVSTLELMVGFKLQELKKLARGILTDAAETLAAAIFLIKSLRAALFLESISIFHM
jgi:hypothetical protein